MHVILNVSGKLLPPNWMWCNVEFPIRWKMNFKFTVALKFKLENRQHFDISTMFKQPPDFGLAFFIAKITSLSLAIFIIIQFLHWNVKPHYKSEKKKASQFEGKHPHSNLFCSVIIGWNFHIYFAWHCTNACFYRNGHFGYSKKLLENDVEIFLLASDE